MAASPAPPQAAANRVWYWQSVDDKQELRHPALIPKDDPALAKKVFLEGQKGPKYTKLSKAVFSATQGPDKSIVSLMEEQGRLTEVPRNVTLQWFEGLLLLEEVDSKGPPSQNPISWWTAEFKKWFDQHRPSIQEKFRLDERRLNAAMYVEKRLYNTAFTGPNFIDDEGKEHEFRREYKGNNPVPTEGEEKDGYFKVMDIVGYLPPWEAFVHEKCGFYQDFYCVRWLEHKDTDFSKTENGATELGCTWEPDECIPSQLDPMRLAAKQAWVTARREKDAQLRKRKSQSATPTPPPRLIKKARKRRDGAPLEKDLLNPELGHDFVPDLPEFQHGEVRSRWPKHPKDYPPGYGAASPPGFCTNSCDCMDDARAQQPWEVRKSWLEDANRSNAADQAIQHFSDQHSYVRRRGTVSKQHFFEALAIFGPGADHRAAKAAGDLAETIQNCIQETLANIPISELAQGQPPVHLPGRSYSPWKLSNDPLLCDLDYEPLRYKVTTNSGNMLPGWVSVHPVSGLITVHKQPPREALPLVLAFELISTEGITSRSHFSIVAAPPDSVPRAWCKLTARVVEQYQATLQHAEVFREKQHFELAWDFSKGSPKELSLGPWLAMMARVLKMLRSAWGTNMHLAPVRGVPLRR